MSREMYKASEATRIFDVVARAAAHGHVPTVDDQGSGRVTVSCSCQDFSLSDAAPYRAMHSWRLHAAGSLAFDFPAAAPEHQRWTKEDRARMCGCGHPEQHSDDPPGPPRPCPMCDGTGKIVGACPGCGGNGCPTCNNTGIELKTCPTCGGSKVVPG